jgi:PilZ domain-containing protein
MNQTEKRSEPRIPVNYSGTLTSNGVSMPCVVQNMCSRGFLIRHSRELPVGQSLHLKCDLYPTRSVECTVQVRHVNSQVLGALVTQMSEEDRRVCLRFLEEHRPTS